MKTRIAFCLVVLGGMLASLPALAQSLDARPTSPWYIGFGGLRSDATIPGESVDAIDTAGSVFLGSTTTLRTVDDRFAGWKLYLGYEFTPNIAVEFGGSSMGTTTAATPASANSRASFAAKVDLPAPGPPLMPSRRRFMGGTP